MITLLCKKDLPSFDNTEVINLPDANLKFVSELGVFFEPNNNSNFVVVVSPEDLFSDFVDLDNCDPIYQALPGYQQHIKRRRWKTKDVLTRTSYSLNQALIILGLVTFVLAVCLLSNWLIGFFIKDTLFYTVGISWGFRGLVTLLFLGVTLFFFAKMLGEHQPSSRIIR